MSRPARSSASSGPNGAGKTSLLRLLSTGRRPTSGTLALLGFPLPASRFRFPVFFGVRSALPVTRLSTWMLSRDRERRALRSACGLNPAEADARAGELLRRFGLAADAGRPVAHYSLGMRHKLLLAQALVHAPRLVILDEPTTGLDREGRDALHALLRERSAAGAAVVLASNDPVEPQRLCDRVVFLHRGRAVLEGEPGELIGRLGAEPRVEIRQPDLGDVFLAATGTELRRPEGVAP